MAESGGVSRRQFLNWLIAAAGVSWLAAALYPVLRYLRPLERTGPGGPVPVPADKLAELEGPKRYIIVRSAGTRVIVLKDARGQLRALSAVCTHEGCTVQYLPGESIIWCACHNAKFSLSGRVISGPPPRPLRAYEVTRSEAGEVLVRVEAAS